MKRILLLCLLSISPQIGWGRVFMNETEALQLAFPENARVEEKSLFFTQDQISKIQKAAKTKMDTEIMTYYVGQSNDGKEVLGYAFFESHIVRTMPETFMVVLTPTGEVSFVEMLAFHEPPDYLPPKKWFSLFDGKKLSRTLWVKRGIRNIVGSTLSTHAVTKGVRKVLAIYNVAISEEKTK